MSFLFQYELFYFGGLKIRFLHISSLSYEKYRVTNNGCFVVSISVAMQNMYKVVILPKRKVQRYFLQKSVLIFKCTFQQKSDSLISSYSFGECQVSKQCLAQIYVF